MPRWLFRRYPRTRWDLSYVANFMAACYPPAPSGYFIPLNKSALWNAYWHATCLISIVLRKSYVKKGRLRFVFMRASVVRCCIFMETRHNKTMRKQKRCFLHFFCRISLIWVILLVIYLSRIGKNYTKQNEKMDKKKMLDFSL